MGIFQAFRRRLLNKFPSLQPEHGAYHWWVLANIMIGTFMAVLDSTIVDVSMPKIMAAFGTSVDKITWIATAYMLVFAVMLPTSGWLADRFGYKRIYFTALLLFTTGSMLCGTAWNENALIFFRVIQAVGGGLMMPVGMAIITREFPPEQRGLALGFWSIAGAASVSFGPLIGGYLIDNLSWQSIFSINVPFGCLGMLSTLIIQREYKSETIHSFDFVGFLSMSAFLSFLLVALADGNAAWNVGGWTSQFIITCFALSFMGLIVFLVTEFSVKTPLVDLGLLKDFNFSLANILLLIFGLGMFGSTFIQPLYLQNALGYTALQSGAVFLPVGIIQAVMSPVSGRMADKLNPKIPLVLGVVFMGFSMYLNSFLSLFSEQAQIMLPLILRGLGMGLLLTPLMSVSMMRISKEKMAQASGFIAITRQVGGSFGVALLGTILIQRQTFHTAIIGQSIQTGSPVFQHSLNSYAAFAKAMAGSSAHFYQVMLQAQSMLSSYLAKQAYVQAINDCYWVTAFLTLAGIIPVLLLGSKQKPQSIANLKK
ncbi:MAG TPA: drug:proton antiporter [Firmicutes bacterium]|jgi:MFS transporter, DHA2 family, multidrug resistance protein|nr:drug:proton antiporter [Bacillota bacterium]